MADCDSLDGGIDTGCENNLGGSRKIWLLEKARVTAVGLSSPLGDISSLTISGSPAANFFLFEGGKNTSGYVENLTSSQEDGRDLYEQTITLVLNRREKTKRDQLLLIARRKDLVALVEDNNGIVWYLGEVNGLNLITNAGGSGVKKDDPNQYVITLMGQESNPANTVTASCYTTSTT